jgi:uncharacterized protein (TIGR02588 family)
LEWILGGVGVVLFASAIAFLIYEGSRGQDQPGGVEIRIDEIIPTDDAYLVSYRAHNQGTQTLVDLHISARVVDGTTELERVEAGIDFLPGESSRQGGFYLREDPRKYRLEVRVGGYQEP